MTDTVPAAPAESTSTAKPIPPGAAPGTPPAERNADGTFKGAPADKPSLARDLDMVGIELTDKDYPKETLPGMADERKSVKGPRVERRPSMRDRLDADKADRVADAAAANAAAAKPSDAKVGGATDPVAPTDPNAPPAATHYKVRAKDDKGNVVDHEFASEEAFHNDWRTMRGMHRSSELKRVNAEEMSRRNYQAAVDWKAKAEAYERGELRPPDRSAPGNDAGQRVGMPPNDSAAATPEDDVVRKIDWQGEYRNVKSDARAMVSRGEITAEDAETLVHAWVARETAKQINASVAARYDPRFDEMQRPAKETQELIGHGQAIIAKLDELAPVTDNAGAILYPEFDGSDPEARRELGMVIGSRSADGISWDHLKSHKGIHESILLWRDWRRMQGRAWSAPVGGNGNGVVAPPVHPQAGIEDAMRGIESRNAGVVAGRSAPPRPAAGSSPASRFRQGVLEAGGNKLANVPWPE